MLPPPPRSTLFPYTTLFRSGLFLLLNLLFAFAYLAVGGVAGAEPGSLADHFFFSVQTMGTIGYGVMHPDRKSTRLNSSHPSISYAVFCLKKKKYNTKNNKKR